MRGIRSWWRRRAEWHRHRSATRGTLGGNVSQDTRCWYYRSGWPCYRAGGNTCYANAPDALNREHAIFDSNRCVAVSPTDTGPALVALDAQMEVHSVGGTRMVPAENFFIGPSTDITRMTVMEPTDLLTAIHIPGRWAGAMGYFEKVADRGSWDFALANVASALDVRNGTIFEARIVIGGVAARRYGYAGWRTRSQAGRSMKRHWRKRDGWRYRMPVPCSSMLTRSPSHAIW